MNSKISLSRFETIIKALFIRMECKRTNENQLGERIIHKRVLSDVLLDIINNGFWYNNKIINESQFKNLKLKPDETSIFKILNNEEQDNVDNLEPEKEDEK